MHTVRENNNGIKLDNRVTDFEEVHGKLMLGCCLERLKEIPSNSIDAVICDLPYGVTKNKWDIKLDLDVLWREYKRVIKKTGVIVLFSDGMFTAELQMSNPKMWKYNLIWDKKLPTGFLNAKRQPLRVHETICVFYEKSPTYNPQFTKGKPNHKKGNKGKVTNQNYGEFKFVDNYCAENTNKYPRSIILSSSLRTSDSIIRISKVHPSKTKHPTEKSKGIIDYLILTYTNVGDTVLDNCFGSGVTCAEAKQLGRKYIGIERDIEYYKLGVQRVKSIVPVESGSNNDAERVD